MPQAKQQKQQGANSKLIASSHTKNVLFTLAPTRMQCFVAKRLITAEREREEEDKVQS